MDSPTPQLCNGGVDAIVKSLGCRDSPAFVASACHAVSAIALASPGDVRACHWRAVAAAAAARLAPADPSRILFVRQMLESAGDGTLADGPARACVAGTALSLARRTSGAIREGSTDKRVSLESAVVAAAANRISVEGVFGATPGRWWRAEDSVSRSVVGSARAFGLPEFDWEASETAGAVAGLASADPLAAVELLHIAASELFSDDSVYRLWPRGGAPRPGPRRALLSAVAKAAPVLARSLASLPYAEARRAGGLIVTSAFLLYLCDPDSTQVHACCLTMVLQRSNVPGAREFAGSSPDLFRVLDLVTKRLPEAVARGDHVSAACALYVLRYHVFSSWRLRWQCSTTPEYGTHIESAMRLACEGLSAEDRLGSQPKTKLMSRPAGLAFLAASSALVLARASPSFPMYSPGLGRQLWALAGAASDPRTAAIVSLSLFYFHALREPGEGGAREFLSHIGKQTTLKSALPFCQTASRLSVYWKDGSLADEVCGEMKRLLETGPASPEDAARAVRMLENGQQSREAAAALVKAAISRAAEPQEV